MKKFLSALVFAICILSVNFSIVNAQNFNIVTIGDVGAWKFMKNFGYENYFEPKHIGDSWINPDILSTYSFLVPCNDIGLGKLGTLKSTGELVGTFGLYITKKSGSIAGFEFYFDSDSEPEKTISLTMSNFFGNSIFDDVERINFGKVITNAKISDEYVYDYYMKSLNIYLEVLKVTAPDYGDGWYKIAIITLKEM